MKYCRESNCKSSLFAGQSQNYLLFFTLRQKCPCSKFFWFVFSRIREKTDQKNSTYGHFLRSVTYGDIAHYLLSAVKYIPKIIEF